MIGSMFLTHEQVCELTDVGIGRAGTTREQLQVAWLRTSGIPFWTNARGRPSIARAATEGQRATEQPRQKLQPDFAVTE
jgi:hypothetical protein